MENQYKLLMYGSECTDDFDSRALVEYVMENSSHPQVTMNADRTINKNSLSAMTKTWR